MNQEARHFRELRQAAIKEELEENPYYLIGKASLGSEAQELSFSFDTALSYNWVAGSKCDFEMCQNEKFSEAESTTYATQGVENSVGVPFMDGEVYGVFATDEI